jgi:hypothetical protein
MTSMPQGAGTIARVGFEASRNLGDAIQSRALELACGRRLGRVDRLALDRDCEQLRPDLVVVNGWFDTHVDDLARLPSTQRTLFIGFRIDPARPDTARLAQPPLRRLLEQRPVGCRDQVTFDWCRRAGIPAWLSGCPTGTLPRRAATDSQTDVFLVDVGDDIPLPDRLLVEGRRVTHVLPEHTPDETQMRMASDQLRHYRDYASLVVTTRLHAALPCVAMGIPVVLFATDVDTRFSAITRLGFLPLPHPVGVRRRLYLSASTPSWVRLKFIEGVDWTPVAPTRQPHQDELAVRIGALLAAM